MTVKTDIFLFTPWFPHLALFQRRQRKYQDGSDAAVTLFQHPFHWDPSSCPGRGISWAMQSKEKQYEENHDLFPRIKWSIQLPKKVNWERREVRRPTHCTALVRFVHFCVNFTLLHLGGFTPQNMLSTGQTPQNLVGSSNLLPKSIEAFIDPSKSYSSLMCPVALEKPYAHRIFDHIFNLEWSSQRITSN